MTTSHLLPLTPFERYMLADSQPGFPMETSMQLHFGGPLDPNLFRQALAVALDRHPLMTARLVGRGWRRCWQLVDQPKVDEVLEMAPDFTSFLAERRMHFNLAERGGLRVQLHVGSAESVITLSAHHAVTDGVGAFQFVADCFAVYQAYHQGRPTPPLPPFSSDALAQRGRPRWIVAVPITRWQAFRGTVREASQWILRRPQPLLGTHQKTTCEPPLPGLRYETLSMAETRALRSFAKAHQATLNDLLLRDLFVTLAKWQRRQASTRPQHWLRINVPTNLRLPGEAPTPSANIIGFAFLTHRIGETDDRPLLLRNVAAEMDAIRRWNLGQLFLDGLARAESIPGALRWFTRSRRCWATTVLSNLGDVRRFMQPVLQRVGREYRLGDAPLRKVVAAPPVRPQTHAAFLASICQEELTITMRAHPDRLSDDQQQQLLRAYLDELRQTATQTPMT